MPLTHQRQNPSRQLSTQQSLLLLTRQLRYWSTFLQVTFVPQCQEQQHLLESTATDLPKNGR
jgi:hypothetical protein